MQLTGRRTVITGASRGIGRAMALEFAKAGATVVAVARDADRLAALVEEINSEQGPVATFHTCDVTDPEEVDRVFGQIVEDGPVDVLVNNAGGNTFSVPLVSMRADGWAKVQRLNVESVVWITQRVLPAMVVAGRGSVINVSSVAGLQGVPLMSHYSAAKAAVISITQSVALETAYAGIRVNALVPGWIETDLTGHLRASGDAEAAILSRVPMQRWGTAAEIAKAALFLASDDSSFMTGQVLVVDGGISVMP